MEAKACAYCGARAVHTDHLIKKNQARRRPAAAAARNEARFKVPACFECNMAIGTRCFVPPSKAHLIDELQRITGNVYGVYDGDPATLRKVLTP